MNKQIRELLDKKAGLVDEAKTLLEAKNVKDAKAKNAEIAELNDQIEAIQALEAQAARGVVENLTTEDAETANAADASKAERLDMIRKKPEYTNAWVHAIRNHATVKDVMAAPGYAPLRNALTVTGGDPVGEDGGFLVPIEFDNLIWELRREYTALADLVTVETVNGYSGWRAVEKAALTTGFASLTEAEAVPTVNPAPKFTKVPYALVGYGGLLEVSNDLLNDSPVTLMRYLASWFARKSVLTENSLILALLKALAVTPFDNTKKITPLRTALNKALDPAISKRAVILTNQSGFDYLDQQVDTTGRPLLQPDVVNQTQYKALGRPVTVLSDALLPNKAGTNEIPVFVGDFKEYIDLFRRGALEMASTNIGGSAFANATTLVRGITRLDAVKIDASAAVFMEIPVAG